MSKKKRFIGHRSLGNLTSRPVFTHSHNPDSYGL